MFVNTRKILFVLKKFFLNKTASRILCVLVLFVLILPISAISLLQPTNTSAESGESVVSGLTNWYKFNEGSGATAVDSIAPVANGTLINGPTYSTNLPPNTTGSGNSNSLNLDGTNDYITVPTPGLPTGDFTYSAWIKPTDHNFATTIFVAPNTLAGNEVALYFTAEGKVNVWSNNTNRFTGSKVAAPGIWTHIALTRTGSAIALYVNGISDGTATSNTVLNFGSCNLLIGVDTDLGCSTTLNEYWKGGMDDFRVYNIGLTQANIQSLFNTTQNGTVTKAPGGFVSTLRGWYKADQGTASTINGGIVNSWKDSSGLNNDIYQDAPARQPKFSTNYINYNPTVAFDDTDNLIRDQAPGEIWPGVGTEDDAGMYIVATETAQSGYTDFVSHPSFLLGAEDWFSATEIGGLPQSWIGGIANNSTATITPGKPFIIGVSTPGTIGLANRQLFFNGKTSTFNNTSLTVDLSSRKLIIGAENDGLSETLNGAIAEVILYNKNISTPADQDKIESYLATKYGITLDQATPTNYISSNGTPFWNSSNTAFNNNITSIGREDISQLNQKQSKSVNANTEAIILSRGNLAASNSANANIFSNDVSYLTAGDNNLTGTTTNTSSCSILPPTRTTRVFNMQSTNMSDSNLVTVDWLGSYYDVSSQMIMMVADDAGMTTNVQLVPMAKNGALWSAPYLASGSKYIAFAGNTSIPNLMTGDKTINWLSTPWNGGSLPSLNWGPGVMTQTKGDTNFTHTVTDAANTSYPKAFWSGYPSYYPLSVGDTLQWVGLDKGVADTVTFESKITNGKVAKGASFVVRGIETYYYKDTLKVEGFLGATAVSPKLTDYNGILDSVSVSGNTATGTAIFGNRWTPWGDVKVDFVGPVDRILVTYKPSATYSPVALWWQEFSISNIKWKGGNPVPAYTPTDSVFVFKDISPTTVEVGEEQTVDFTFKNISCGNKTINFSDILPNGSFVVDTLLGSGGTANSYGGSNTLTLTGAVLPPGETTMSVKIKGTSIGSYTNQATFTVGANNYTSDVESTIAGPDATPYALIASTKITPVVTLTKSANVSQIAQNGVVTYTLVVNNASTVAMKADLADTLAGAQTYVAGTLTLPGTVTGGFTIGNNGATPPAETYGGGNLLSLTGYTWPVGTTTITIQANVNNEPLGNTLKNNFDLVVIDPTFQTGRFDSNQTSVLLADILDVALNQGSAQPDPQSIGVSATNIVFNAIFSQDISTSSFTSSDIVLGGTATGCSVSSVTANPGAQLKIFDIVVNCGINPTNHNKTITASLAAGSVQKNLTPAVLNTATTTSDNIITLVDTTPPPAPSTAPDMTAGTDTGSSNTDNVTSNTTPTFTGTCTNGDSVILFKDGVVITPTQVCAAGAYSITPATPFVDGVYNMTTKFTDPAGNISAQSPVTMISVDTTAPVAPVVPDMTPATDTGSSNTDNITSNTTPTFIGTCTTGETITLFVDSSPITPTSVCSSGTYSFTPANPLAPGVRNLTTTTKDLAGNTSAQSAPLAITIDSSIPSVPSAPDLVATSDTGPSSTDNITSDTTPTFDGTCTTGDTVKLFDGATQVGTQVCAGGVYSITPTLADGVRSITTTSTNPAGNTSPASSPLNVTIDSSAPTTPTTTPDMTAATDTGSSNTDNVTSNATPAFTGTCTTGDTVTLYKDAALVTPTQVCSGGIYSITPTTPFVDGTFSITTTVTDPAGNASGISPVTLIAIDTLAPSAPVISAPANNSSVSTSTPTFLGTGENGSTVTVKDENGNIVCTEVVTAGVWTCTLTTQTEGNHVYTPSQTDLAGNTSLAGTPVTIKVDTATPAAPVLSTVDGKPASPSPETNNTTPTLVGTSEPGALILVKDGITPLVCVEGNPLIANASGAWTCTPTSPLTPGTHPITVTQTDTAGNISPATSVVNVIIDTTAPTATVEQSAGQLDSTHLNSLNFTVVFSEAIDPATFTPSDLLVTASLASPSIRTSIFTQLNATTWSIEIKDVANGATVTVSIPTSVYKDKAGNTGSASTSSDNQITYLVPPPNVDQLYTNNPTPVLSGQCAVGASLQITVVGRTPINIPTTCTAGATWSLPWTGGAIPDGTYDVKIDDSTNTLNNHTTPNLNSSVGKLVLDTVKPTPTITRSTGQLAATNIDQAKFDIIFDKPIIASTLVLSDFTITNAPGSTNTLTQVSPTKWELLITGQANGNSVTIDLAANTTADVTGNLSNTANLTSNTVLYDISTPTAPVITAPTSGSSTNDNTPTFVGTGETGATVTIKDQSGNTICTTVVIAGAWSCTPSISIPDGQQTFQVTQTDPSGNTSPATLVPLKIDTSVPASPVITSPTLGSSTTDNTPTITGTGEPGATVVVKDGATPIVCTDGNPVIIPPIGNWSCTPVTPLTEGSHSLTATQIDPAGNTSPATTPLVITVDTTLPTAAVITSPATGSSTNDNTPTFIGTGTPGDSVTIKDTAGNPIPGCINIVIPPSGTWTCTPVSPLPDGSTTFTPVTTDPAGNLTNGAPITVIIDTVPPTSAVITSPTSGSATNDTTPTFTGTGTVGDTVMLKDTSGNPIPGCINIVIPVGGIWTCTPTNPLPTGSNTINPVTTDPAGNSTNGTPIVVNVDTTPPTAPAITGPVSGLSTNDTTPTITGTGTPGDTVVVKDGATPIACVEGNPLVIPPSGTWTCTPTTPLSQGPHTITATETDPAGNTSPASTPITVTVDTTPPTAAVITGPALTNTTTPVITGTGTPGDTVTLKDALGNPISGCVNLVISPSGTWTCTPIISLPSGNNTITSVTIDPAGNQTIGTPVVINIDITPPVAAVITGPALTNTTSPVITGTGTPGDTVTVKDVSGNPIPGCINIVIPPSGTWTCTPPTPLPEGANTLTPTTTDPAGNQTSGSPLVVVVDTIPPVTPAVGTPTNNSSTNNTTPPIAGTGTPGNTIKALVDGTPIVCAEGNPLIIPPSGNWTCTPTVPLTPGNHVITVIETDPAGNTSPASAPKTVIIDVTPPSAPTVNPITTPNSDNTPTTTGTGEPGATITVTVTPTGEVLTAIVAPNGTWTITPVNPVPDGPSSFTVKQTDPANNFSPTIVVTGPIIDTTAPLAPVITGPTSGTTTTDDTPTFIGTTEPNAVVKVRDEFGNTICTVTADNTGAWTCTPIISQGEGLKKYTATATDGVGNISPASVPAVTLFIDINTDSVSKATEDLSPNAGDSNGDGVLDSEQSTVATKPNPGVDNNYMTLQTDGVGCGNITNLDYTLELPLPTQDDQFVYPVGLFKFALSCTTPGSSTLVTFILDKQYDTSTWKYRKFKNNTYTDVSSLVAFGTRTVGSQVKTTISYIAVDGGILDEDGIANGIFIDPSGPAIIDPALAKTGQNTAMLISISLAILTVSVLLTLYRKSKRTTQIKTLSLYK